MSQKVNQLILVIISLALFGLLAVAQKSPSKFIDAQTTSCQTGYNLLVPNAVPGGPVTVALNLATMPSGSIDDVIFKLDSAILGRGVQTSTGPQWQMVWYAQYSSPGPHSVGAQVNFSGGSSCTVAAISTTVNGTSTSGAQLKVVASPNSYTGLANQAINFTLNAGIQSSTSTSTDVSTYTYFSKQPQTLGSISPLNGSQTFRFSAGPAAGSGKISIVAYYGGQSVSLNIPISLQTQTASSGTTNTPASTSPSGTTSTTPTATTTDQTIAAASAASVDAEPAVKNCVLSKLGQTRFDAISTGNSRPTAAEFDSINQCFATRNYVLPSGFVPISPTAVKDQPISKEVAINAPKDDSSNKIAALKFSGKAKPKSVVLLYVYSEPLVLSTVADSTGSWSYSLVDPLQPGSHEAYAVVDKGDGTYQRSSVLDFAIAKASASAENPNGYSLKLESIQATATNSSKASWFYLGGTILLVIIVLSGLTGVVVLKRRHKSVKVASSDTVIPSALPVTGQIAPTEFTPPTPDVPEQPTPPTLTEPTQTPVLPTKNQTPSVEPPASQTHEP